MCKKSSGGYRDRLGYNWLWTATCGEQGVSTESGLVQISNQGWSLEASGGAGLAAKEVKAKLSMHISNGTNPPVLQVRLGAHVKHSRLFTLPWST
jgi:hypothetical protein